ncbi:DUF6461 domain-containing protein [Actinoplanes sp. NPDC049548]|uniref:DUF6461 domain-containing protein n=1 Tax=Actinoplanes sp. NPDC049548 TaxID=3155152 RepID=UPI00343BD491
MTSSAEDYGWFTEDYALGLDFCLTFVRDVAPDRVLERLGGQEPVELVGAARLQGGADLVPMRPDVINEDGHFDADRTTGLAFIAAAAVGDWTMIVEPGGFLCTEDPVVQALSLGGELVTLYQSEHNDPRFLWARDGVVLVDLDPTSAGWRDGAEPDRLDSVLVQLGFDLSTEELDPDDPGYRYDEQWQERALALMHHLTGVRLTVELLETAVFRCAAVPDAPSIEEELASQVRARLRAYADDPDGETELATDDEWTTDDAWADERLLKTGATGHALYVSAPSLILALAQADEHLVRRVTRWARLWAFAEAELIDEPWFATVRRAVERAETVSEFELERARANAGPLPVGPTTGPDGRPDRASRRHMALFLLTNPDPDPLSEAAHTLITAAHIAGYRFDRLTADLLRDLPELR